eukprot:CAMPEP_0113938148 /NCGR_PEP_ID=MMETSP1339-20121228/4549_1 /TAXON_ID=94617 /ORGANISM="Fibrocapsa japonica" /LENGTH=231 /DNA_ID=CAMNT_0000941109 /DNA_START=133 /DNA_END=828 /DNA_ORIENTATION=+ /assembly_acc=CAM_ASM_000762
MNSGSVNVASNTAATNKIILGSGSRTRREILQEMGYEVIVRAADIDERAIGAQWRGGQQGPDGQETPAVPHELVLALGKAKAEALLERWKADSSECDLHHAEYLLTADQVVVCEGKILEKPVDGRECRQFIERYAHSPCSTVGSAVLTKLSTGEQVSGWDTTTIHFNRIPDDIVDALIEEGEVLWCAGGLMIEHDLVQPYIRSIDGDIDSVMGLSKKLVAKLYQKILPDSF